MIYPFTSVPSAWLMTCCSVGIVVVDNDKKRNGCWMRKRGWDKVKETMVRNIFEAMLRTGEPHKTCNHSDKFTTDPIRRLQPGQVAKEHSRKYCVVHYEKRTDIRRFSRWEKKMFCLVWNCLSPVTFSPATHHSLMFFILSWYMSASLITDLFSFIPLSLSLSLLGLNLYTRAVAIFNLKFSQNVQRRLWHDGPKERVTHHCSFFSCMTLCLNYWYH